MGRTWRSIYGGPDIGWSVVEDIDGYTRTIATGILQGEDKGEYTAKLISASPDLFEALAELKSLLEQESYSERKLKELINDARSALFKALY